MPDQNQNGTNNFIVEKVKQRPLNKARLLRKTITTACMAVIFGSIACATFLLLEPIISKQLYPEEKPQIVTFPEDPEEMQVEDMLAENLTEESEEPEESTHERVDVNVQPEEISLTKDNYVQMYQALADYIQTLDKYLVTVTAVSSNEDWLYNIQENKNKDYGVMIQDNGVELLILTTSDILKKADNLVVTFSNGSQAGAVLKKKDTTTGLAVLAVQFDDLPQSIKAEELEYPTLGSSNNSNMLGMPVIAVGSPSEAESIGYGMITAASAIYSVPERNYKILRTDILGSTSPSGVLFDLEGRLIGILTGPKESSDVKNLVYAYGITEMRKLLEKLANDTPIAYLGITGITVPQEANNLLGVPLGGFIKKVDMDSPAMRAGIVQGDIITNVNGRNISTYNEYTNVMMALAPGESVEMTVKRKVLDEYKEMTFIMEAGAKE